MPKFIKNISLYTIGNILPLAASFILLPIYTKYLSPADYGIVNSLDVLSSALVVLFTLTLDRAIPRLYFDYKTESEQRDFLGTIFFSQVLIGIIVLGAMFLFPGIVEKVYKSIKFYPYYAIALSTIYFSSFANIPKTYLRIHDKAKQFVAISIIQFLISAGLVLLFIVYFKEGASGMLKGKMLANLLLVPFFCVFMMKIVNLKIDIAILKTCLAFSLPMIPSFFSSWILNLSDRMFIERYFTLKDVGIYSMGYTIAGLVIIFTSAFISAYQPTYFRLANSEDQESARQKLYTYNRGYIIVMILGVFLISFVSREIIAIVLSYKFHEAYKIVPLISIAYFISQFSGVLNLSIYQKKKSKELMYIMIATAAINILLNFILVPQYGVYGAAYSTILSFATGFIITYIYSKKCYFIPFEWKEIILLSISLLAVYFFGMLISSHFSAYLALALKAAVSIIILLASYKIFAVRLKLFSWKVG